MPSRILVAMLGASAVPLALSAARAQESAPAAAAQPAPPAPDPFTQAITARAVADYGRRQKDAQAMIVAARMLQEIPFKDAGGVPADAAFTPAGLFGEAKGLARGDQATLTQIRIAESMGSRGVFDSVFGKGLVRLVQSVAGGTTFSFPIRAVGGQILRIGAIGALGTAMLLRLVAAAGHIACADDNNDYAPVCALTPRATASYKVELVNRSRRPSRTVILSN